MKRLALLIVLITSLAGAGDALAAVVLIKPDGPDPERTRIPPTFTVRWENLTATPQRVESIGQPDFSPVSVPAGGAGERRFNRVGRYRYRLSATGQEGVVIVGAAVRRPRPRGHGCSRREVFLYNVTARGSKAGSETWEPRFELKGAFTLSYSYVARYPSVAVVVDHDCFGGRRLRARQVGTGTLNDYNWSDQVENADPQTEGAIPCSFDEESGGLAARMKVDGDLADEGSWSLSVESRLEQSQSEALGDLVAASRDAVCDKGHLTNSRVFDLLPGHGTVPIWVGSLPHRSAEARPARPLHARSVRLVRSPASAGGGARARERARLHGEQRAQALSGHEHPDDGGSHRRDEGHVQPPPLMPNDVLTHAIDRVANGEDLAPSEASGVLAEIVDGNASEAQAAAFLIALRTKGETVGEIAGLAAVLRERSVKVEAGDDLVDTAGTGGGRPTFNVSTTAAFVAAGAGCRVAKHGNRSATSQCGSADVLEALGGRIDLAPEAVADCIGEIGFGFMFAPLHHPTFKHIVPVRKELAVRTIFNFLGPLTNPAGALRQVIGVSDPGKIETMAAALGELGAERALVVSSADGLDEFSVSGATRVVELRDGRLSSYEVTPDQVDIELSADGAVGAGTPEQNAQVLRGVLSGTAGTERSLAVLNAGAAIYVAGRADSLAEGVRAAERSIDDGAAASVLERWVGATAA